jgi:hypothetical protein
MVVTYCTVTDVSDFLRVPITATTTPNTVQVEKLINRKEAEIERRIGHAWTTRTITEEVHDLPLVYSFGWGTPIFLQHRMIKDLNGSLGDKIEIWQGSQDTFSDILGNNSWYNIEGVYGKLFLRGFIFSILRKHRVRVTYRYGDSVVPGDITDAVIKMVAIEIINTSFRMDKLPMGGSGISMQTSTAKWQEDIDRTISDRMEVFVCR